MQELWICIEGFDYSVSNLGNVKNDKTDRILKPNTTPSVNLRKHGEYHCLYLPKLVANYWVPNRWSKIFDTPLPMDGDKYNCIADNLDWRPRWFIHPYVQERRHPKYPAWKPEIVCLDTGEYFRNLNEAGRAYGMLEWDIFSSIANGTQAFPHWYRFEIS